jgi:radical SAM protein with 4Fe4S-binding SPASM domain
VRLSHAVLGHARPAAEAGAAVPHVVAWNLTRRCNLSCAHCYIAAGPDVSAAGELSTDEVCRIADEILALNPSPMFIFSGGEPLLREDLGAIARHASERGATVVVGTNATLLDDARITELMACGVTGVAVSVDSLRPAYHDRFRRGPGALEATLAGVERLAAHGLDFVVQATLTRGNRDELADVVEWAAGAGAVSFNAYLLVATGRGEHMSALTPEDGEAVLVELVDLHAEHLGSMMVRAKCAPQFMRLVHRRAPYSPVLNYPTRCPCGVHYCRITPHGELTPCPYMPAAAGDLRRAGFAEVWHGSALLASLRDAEPGGKCGDCGYRAMCGGCRARAYAATGDPLGPDPACAYQPDGVEPTVERASTIAYGAVAEHTLPWSEEAQARMRTVPSFVRGVVVRRVEDYARREGHVAITVDLLAEVRRAMPVDFSKRRPFFLRGEGQ